MATYTNTTTFSRDVYPVGAGETFPRLLERGAVIAYNYINSRLASLYTVPFAAPYPGIIVDISDLMTRCVAMKLQSGRVPAIQMDKPKAKREGPQDDCALAVMMLDELVIGTGIIPGLTPIAASSGYHTRATFTPIFDVDSSISHYPDSDLIDKINRERE